ncbi:MAG: dinitrogenase iron-molybdenum cofactor biosynthesis protein [Chloroflexi bacterium]|nr:dinitrogenase iron-molybdenum cofactor biosynthesis protein [Chloroflexota bacterium]
MRIAVSSEGAEGLQSVVSPHFGRCPYFAVVEVEGCEVKAVETVANPFYPQHQPGQVPAFINTLCVDVMLTGGMGGRAVEFFRGFGIESVTGAVGTVRYAVEQYLGGALSGAEACAHGYDHAAAPAAGDSPYERDDVGRLQDEAEMLKRQLDEAQRRLNRLRG